ncbi:FAD-dependent monooxygenase [Pedobacter sp. AW1-32]|uniref:FAD-dependent monooxygenase n=1 Tax=Pedobacter sp. AW1-32 TaxID=3383026 RepID=UPI003FEDDC0B
MKARKKTILISGASMAGLSTAFWMNKLGYMVTVVEISAKLRTNGTAVDIKGNAVNIIKQMGMLDAFKAQRLQVNLIEFKNDQDITETKIDLNGDRGDVDDQEIEIERGKFLEIVFKSIKNEVEFLFDNQISNLMESENQVSVAFKSGLCRNFDLVIGCDGMHSGVRKLWFGEEREFSQFLGAYFSVTIVDKLLIETNTMQMYNVPGKSIMLNAYNNKTDVIFCFLSEEELIYHYKDHQEQNAIIYNHFKNESWRTRELLQHLASTENFYFDKFCQVKMPSWTKGRVALVGDAAYCASPAAGMGASLALEGAAALAASLQKFNGETEYAFEEYNKILRPFVEEIQAVAEYNIKENFIPRTEEAIRKRNENPGF